MDLALTVFHLGVGIGALLIGIGVVLAAIALLPLSRDLRALARDARRLGNRLEQLESLAELDEDEPRPAIGRPAVGPVQSPDAAGDERIA